MATSRSVVRPLRQESQPDSVVHDKPVASEQPPAAQGDAEFESTYERYVQERNARNGDAAEADTQDSLVAGEGSPFSVQLNLDFTNAYFYRGIRREDQGLIVQPAARFMANLHRGEDWRIDGFLATWNSFHSEKTGARTHGDFTDTWYECDLTAGFTLIRGPLSLTTSYTFLTSPGDAHETVQELGFNLALDDTPWLGGWAMKPYATLVFETGADGSDSPELDRGTYLELGITPGFTCNAGKTPVTLTFPVSVGLSLDDYYQDASGDDDTFGFVQVGAKAAVPLPFGDRYGTWTLNVGVAGLFLGDHTAEINGGNDAEFLGSLGLQLNF